jgi:hypothetical protein
VLDQTFALDNFRRIYDKANRRGKDLEAAFFPDVAVLTNAAKVKIAALRGLRDVYGPISQQVSQQIELLQAEVEELKRDKETLINESLESVASNVRAPGFNIGIHKKTGPSSKPIYTTDNDAESFFVSKQLQSNLRRLYGIKQSNRDEIVSQLKGLMKADFPVDIVKFDISEFYESIDQSQLERRLANDQLLSMASKKFIRQILKGYRTQSNSSIGVPRGVGVSAYLSELYMRSVDEAILRLHGIIYYARFVDDGIAVFSKSPEADNFDRENDVRSVLSGHGLVANPDKTESYHYNSTNTVSLDYLGYNFRVAGGSCQVRISAGKIKRYKDRIDRVFDAYLRKGVSPSKAQHRILIARLNYLTANTRLTNSKRFALIGIYFSNSHLSDPAQLSALDSYLQYKALLIHSLPVRRKVSSMSFVRGFTQRTFRTYSTRRIAQIVEAWEYGA